MRDQMEEFEMLLDDVLREVANPEPADGLGQRIMLRVEMSVVQAPVVQMGLADGAMRPEGVVRSLWSSLRELIVPNGLSPLVLRPVGDVDGGSEGRRYRSTGWAMAVHVFAVLMVGFAATTRIHIAAPVKTMAVSELVVPPKINPMGGGGGQRGETPVTKGTPPKFAETQIVPPKAPPMEEPKIHIEPTIEVQKDVRMASSIPQIGVANSPLVGMSMGNGVGSGLGSGSGSGLGPGSGGNTGGGVRQVGGAVSAPVLLYQVDPEFSEEARKSKTAGDVLVDLWVDEKGNPSHVRVVRGIGMGLDEKAVAAVKLYKFRPAMENGKPVTVEMNVDVTFNIF
jgi:periplasmic protein TonB